MTFWVYAALVGLSLSSVLLIYTGQSVVQTFFITAASFGALSLYGYSTKRDLSAMGSFLVMGLFGLIIASIVNIFLGSSALQFAISVIGVLIFAGLTAYDTQRIKEMYYEADGAEVTGRKAIMGALTLYLDFINLFMFLLQFMGNRSKTELLTARPSGRMRDNRAACNRDVAGGFVFRRWIERCGHAAGN